MSIASANRFIDQMESEIEIAKAKIAAAEKRGAATPAEEESINRARWHRLPVLLCSFEIAAKAAGKRVRDRSDMVPDIRAEKGLHVVNSIADGKNEIYLYGPIGESFSGISADEFRAALSRFSPADAVHVHVHSGGGSFLTASAIHSIILNRPGRTIGYCDGKAASAGSVILLPCDEVVMATASELMIHNCSIDSEGSWGEEDLEKTLKRVKDTNEKLVQLYLPRWKKTEAELREALRRETYFNAVEAVEHGLADRIAPTIRVAAYQSLTTPTRGAAYEIAACEQRSKRLRMRQRELKLWELELFSMRREIAD